MIGIGGLIEISTSDLSSIVCSVYTLMIINIRVYSILYNILKKFFMEIIGTVYTQGRNQNLFTGKGQAEAGGGGGPSQL